MINLSVCLSRYGMPKDKDSGKDNNYYYYYYDDDVSWAAMEVYDDETSCVLCSMYGNDEISIISAITTIIMLKLRSYLYSLTIK